MPCKGVATIEATETTASVKVSALAQSLAVTGDLSDDR